MDRFSSAENDFQDDVPKNPMSKFVSSGTSAPSQSQNFGKIEIKASRNTAKQQAQMPPPAARTQLGASQSGPQQDAGAQRSIPVPSWAAKPPQPGILNVEKAGYHVDKVTLSEAMTVIGRGQNANYVMDHQSLSRLHAAVCYQKKTEKWVIFDLGSVHGTLYDGRPVKSQPVEIKPGNKIQLGASSRTLVLQGQPGAATESTAGVHAADNRHANVKIVLKQAEERQDPEVGPRLDDAPGKFAGVVQETYTPASDAAAKKGVKRTHEQTRRRSISQPLNYGLYDHLPDTERWS